jgi:hypothetical protein
MTSGESEECVKSAWVLDRDAKGQVPLRVELGMHIEARQTWANNKQNFKCQVSANLDSEDTYNDLSACQRACPNLLLGRWGKGLFFQLPEQTEDYQRGLSGGALAKAAPRSDPVARRLLPHWHLMLN